MTFRQFLELKFLEWQRESGGRKTVLEFAKYLGVSQQTVSSWWNNPNKIPEGANVQKLAQRLGLEVYDVLGLPRPDEDLHIVQKLWDLLTPAERRAWVQSLTEFERLENLPLWIRQNPPTETNRALHLLLDSIIIKDDEIELKFK